MTDVVKLLQLWEKVHNGVLTFNTQCSLLFNSIMRVYSKAKLWRESITKGNVLYQMDTNCGASTNISVILIILKYLAIIFLVKSAAAEIIQNIYD